jgi:hypothetical protein
MILMRERETTLSPPPLPAGLLARYTHLDEGKKNPKEGTWDGSICAGHC